MGHRWQWGWFTLGAEWLGLYVPIAMVESRHEVRLGSDRPPGSSTGERSTFASSIYSSA